MPNTKHTSMVSISDNNKLFSPTAIIMLAKFVAAPVSMLEAQEKLEQLRLLENGLEMHVLEASEFVPAGIDTSLAGNLDVASSFVVSPSSFVSSPVHLFT